MVVHGSAHRQAYMSGSPQRSQYWSSSPQRSPRSPPASKRKPGSQPDFEPLALGLFGVLVLATLAVFYFGLAPFSLLDGLMVTSPGPGRLIGGQLPGLDGSAVRAKFDQFDKNADGLIDATELDSKLIAAGEGSSLLRDGRLALDEFYTLLVGRLL